MISSSWEANSRSATAFCGSRKFPTCTQEPATGASAHPHTNTWTVMLLVHEWLRCLARPVWPEPTGSTNFTTGSGRGRHPPAAMRVYSSQGIVKKKRKESKWKGRKEWKKTLSESDCRSEKWSELALWAFCSALWAERAYNMAFRQQYEASWGRGAKGYIIALTMVHT